MNNLMCLGFEWRFVLSCSTKLVDSDSVTNVASDVSAFVGFLC